MYPPPIIATDPGTSGLIIASSLVITTFPSISRPGRVLGTEPVARSTLSLRMSRASSPSTEIPCAEVSLAAPLTSVILFLRKSPSTPRLREAEAFLLFSTTLP